MTKYRTALTFSITCFVVLGISLFLYSCGSGVPTDPNNPNTQQSSNIAISTQNTSIQVGGLMPFNVIYYNTDGTVNPSITNTSVSWVSSDPTIVTIDNQGMAMGLAKGTASISAVYAGMRSQYIKLAVGSSISALVVFPASATIYLRPKTITASIAQQFRVTATINNVPQDVTFSYPATTWQSSDPNMATVDNWGYARTSFKPGTVGITASYDIVTSLSVELLVACREYLYFAQDVLPWGPLPYDHSIKTIGQVGCLLADTSMILSSLYGATYDPLALNTIYNNNYDPVTGQSFGFSGGDVKLDKIALLSNYQISTPTIIDYGRAPGSTSFTFDYPIPLTTLDFYVDQCNAVIVGVRSQSSKGVDPTATHYILVTGREKNTYTILDPAWPGIRTLDRYGAIYYIVAYSII